MRSSIRRRLLLALRPWCVLALLPALSSCASTTPRLLEAPQLPPAPAPAECTRAAFEAFAPELAGLPVGYGAMNEADQAKTLLALKAGDTTQYQLLRAQAIRCAR
jgi:hypothetical protein